MRAMREYPAEQDGIRDHCPGLDRTDLRDSLSFLPWITTPIFVCTLGISCTQLLPQSVNKPLAWVGGISAAIFVSHPIVRQLGLALAEKLHFSPYQSVLTFLISALLLGTLFPAYPQSLIQAFHEAG